MICPHCKKPVPALSTKCPECTGDYSRDLLWGSNILGTLLAAVVLILLLRACIG